MKYIYDLTGNVWTPAARFCFQFSIVLELRASVRIGKPMRLSFQMAATHPKPPTTPTAEDRYQQAIAEYGAALNRLVRAYAADEEKRKDLIQEIHIALWRSFSLFDRRCSLRTWIYRVAHNTATSKVLRRKGTFVAPLISLDQIDESPAAEDQHETLDRKQTIERLYALIQSLKPIDRQVFLLYLEGMDAGSISEITGVSAGNVSTKVHRIKNILIRRFHEEDRDGR